MKIAITDHTAPELAEALSVKPFQAKQILRWIHDKKVFAFEEMTDLSKTLRATLQERATASQLELLDMQVSEHSGTRKALYRLHDGETVESVLIRDRDRVTICVSSQVGCALQCDFCATGLAGFTRNLSAGEIVEQSLVLLKDEDLGERTPNIVYMGMGEPMRNFENVVKSIHLLMMPEGLGIGARKITVSTAGDAKQIERFADEGWQVRLSISLHGANDDLRSKLVPLNKKFNLTRLREALAYYAGRTGRQITFEWTLLNGVNDRDQDVRELVDYSMGLKASVNFIPWNPVTDIDYKPTPAARCREICEAVRATGMQCTLRQEKGQDIDAACGQLRRTHAV